MPRKRNAENQALPSRWQFRPDGYYYRVRPGFEHAWDGKRFFFLGRSLPQAYREWATRLKTGVVVTNVGTLLDRYSLEVVPTKAIATQEGNAFGIVRLKSILGGLRLAQVTPQVVHQYFDQRQQKVSAHREIEILSHAYTKAVEWGYRTRHPFRGELRLPAEQTRQRYLEDWEVAEMLTLEPRRKAGSVKAIQAYIRLMLLTGLRRVDLLRIEISSLHEHGIEVEAGSARDSVACLWTDELRTAIDLALQSRQVVTSPWIFCKADGTGYFNSQNGRADGWDSMWGRFVDRALSETNIVQRFTEHDLRAKFAIDSPIAEHSQALVTLADVRATQRFGERRQRCINALGEV